ncbi:hypothetical protein OKW35_000501 [Paraburkholderia sp. MM5477-R1]|uniref:Uncharacterized protein n=1 Tax=Paraburkholderia tuberum TaxID=157910 RepID=A0A1H1KHH6_9BURK|nr:hypothetical protein SAMN05445850_7811 [Paraburkholderia tuberum]
MGLSFLDARRISKPATMPVRIPFWAFALDVHSVGVAT